MVTEIAVDRQLRLDVRCPNCRQVPKLRVYESQAARYRVDPPATLVLTYECHGKIAGAPRCNERYAITAGAFQRAS